MIRHILQLWLLHSVRILGHNPKTPHKFRHSMLQFTKLHSQRHLFSLDNMPSHQLKLKILLMHLLP